MDQELKEQREKLLSVLKALPAETRLEVLEDLIDYEEVLDNELRDQLTVSRLRTQVKGY